MHTTEILAEQVQNLIVDHVAERLGNSLPRMNTTSYFELDTRFHSSTARTVPDRRFMIDLEFGELRLLPEDKGRAMYNAKRCDYVTIERWPHVKDKPDGWWTAIVFLYPAPPLMRP